MKRHALVIALILGAPASAAALEQEPSAEVPPPGEPALRAPQRPSEPLVLEPARLDDGQNLRLPPLVIAQERGNKDRAVMWIGGLLVLAAAFLWNRNRRLELERQELASSKRSGEGAASPNADTSPAAAASSSADASPTAAASPSADAPHASDPGRPSKEP